MTRWELERKIVGNFISVNLVELCLNSISVKVGLTFYLEGLVWQLKAWEAQNTQFGALKQKFLEFILPTIFIIGASAQQAKLLLNEVI